MGEVVSRDGRSVRIKSELGTIRLSLSRVEPAEEAGLDHARAALERGDATDAERLATIALFWDSDNADAAEMLRAIRDTAAEDSSREAYEKLLEAYRIAVSGEVHPVDRGPMLAKLEPALEKLARDKGRPETKDYEKLLKGVRSARKRNHFDVYGQPTRDERFQNLEALEDPRADEYLKLSMAAAREMYGPPRIPVKRVHLTKEKRLRQNTRTDGSRGGIAGYTYIVDSETGQFGINMGIRPDKFKFYKTLAHEVLHTSNSRLTSVYMEGLCEVFSHKMLAREKEMRTYYSGPASKDKDFRPVYARAFLMMEEVDKIAGPEYMKTFLRYVEYTNSVRVQMKLDINAWLATMDEETRGDVRAVILRHAPDIKRAQTKQFAHLTFPLPD